MSSDNSVQDVIFNLNSSKKKDRVNALGIIPILVRQERTARLLSLNEKIGINWDTLFLRVHGAIHAEASRSSNLTSKLFDVAHNAISSVTKFANGQIEINSITSAIHSVYESVEASSSVGSIYYEIISNHLLEHCSYLSRLRPDDWSGLVKLSQKQIEGQSSSSIRFLELLYKIVSVGRHYALKASLMKTLLPFLQRILLTNRTPYSTFDWFMLRTVNETLEILVGEARYSLAEFIEDTTSAVIRLFELGKEKNQHIFRFLSIAIDVHHPKGSVSSDGIAYAKDWIKWQRLIKDMHELCELEIREILLAGRRYEMYADFMELLTRVTYLVSIMPHTIGEAVDLGEYSKPVPGGNMKRKSIDCWSQNQTQKRAKLEGGLVYILQNLNSSDAWFWLSLLNGVLEKYPLALRQERGQLCSLVCNLLCESREASVLQPLSKCAKLLIDQEKETFDDSSETSKSVLDASWEKVAETITRNLAKDNSHEKHLVLQSLILHSKWKNVSSLLDLYMNNEIDATSSSMLTLSVILQTGLKMENEKKCALLKWCLKSSPVLHIAPLVVTLLGKEEHFSRNRKLKRQYSRASEIYEKLAFADKKPLYAISHDTSHNQFTTPNFQVLQSLEEILDAHCKRLINNLEDPDVNNIRDSIHIIQVILITLSTFWTCPDFHRSPLISFLETLFQKVLIAGTHLMNLKILRLNLFSQLYGCDLHPEVHQLIRQSEPFMDVLQFAYCEWNQHNLSDSEQRDLMQKWSGAPYEDALIQYSSAFSVLLSELFPDSSSNLRREAFSSKNNYYTFLIDASEMFCEFINCPGPMNSYQSSLARNITSIIQELQEETLKSDPYLQMALRTVHNLGICPTLPTEVLNHCLDILIRICKINSLHYEVLAVLLAIVRALVSTIKNQGDSVTFASFARLLDHLRSKVRNTTYPITNLEYLKLLSTISIADPNGKWAVWQITEDRMGDELLTYLGHESVEVRLCAAEQVGNLFIPCEKKEIEQKNLLQSLKAIVTSASLNLDNYEQSAHVALCFHSLSNVFCVSSPLRLQTAYLCIEVVSSLNLNNGDVENLLKLLSTGMKTSNMWRYFQRHLKDLLRYWLKDGYAIKNFPHTIVNCANKMEFYSKYIDIIMASSVILNISMLGNISSLCNIPAYEVVEMSFPILLAEVYLNNSKVANDFINKFIELERREELMFEKIALCLLAVLRSVTSEALMITTISKFPSEAPLLRKLATEQPSSLQNVLLHLEGDIVESITTEDFLASLRKYVWFVDYYLKDIQMHQFNVEMNIYILRDMFSVILRALWSTSCPLAVERCCDCFRRTLDTPPEFLKQEISDLLPGFISSLVTLIAPSNTKSEPALALLQFIVNKLLTQYDGVLERLDPFPDDDLFKSFDLRRDDDRLEEELTKFSVVVGHGGRRIGGLSRLLRSLSTRKDDLRKIYEQIDGLRGFSEDCTESVLHKVIYQLVNLCAHNDNDIRIETAKCLGELGAADLTTLVLRPSEKAIADHSSVELRFIDTVKILLGELIQQETFIVKKAASSALYAVSRCESTVQSSSFYAPFCNFDSCSLQLAAKDENGPALSIWVPERMEKHEKWITKLVRTLLSSLTDSLNLCELLGEVCDVHAPFSESILPLILNLVIDKGSSALIADISKNVSTFFTKHLKDATSFNVKSVRCLVESIDYIRSWGFRAGKYKLELDIDLLIIAEAASRCDAHFTALMFAELWFEEQKLKYFAADKTLMHLYVDDLQDRRDTMSKVLRHCYASVGIQDGLHGCGTSHLANPAMRASYLEQLGHWNLSLITHDATKNLSGEISALRHHGLYNALSFIPADASVQLECALRLGNWSFEPPSECASSFQLHHFNALKAYHNGDVGIFNKEIHCGMMAVVQQINDSKIESTKNLYESLSHLQCMKELLDFSDAKQKNTVKILEDKWKLQDSFKPSDFMLQEKVLSARCAIVKVDFAKTEDVEMKRLLSELYLRFSKLARRSGKYDVALKNIFELNMITNLREDILSEGKIEEARILWEKGEQKMALFLLGSEIKKLDSSTENNLKAMSLRLYGDWMIQRKEENARNIIENYFLPSLSLRSQTIDRIQSFNSIARFADSNYVQLKEYLDSPIFETKLGLMMEQNKLAAGLRRTLDTQNGHNVRDRQHAIAIASKQSAIDEGEQRILHQESEYFLQYAIRYYSKTLQCGDKFDHVVFRLVSLWLNNCKNRSVVSILQDHLPSVPSHKFLCVLPQISPRIADVPLIESVVERALTDHPYHTLPVLFALKNSFADQKYYSVRVKVPAVKRVQAASALLERARQCPQTVRIIDQMSQFTEAMIELANTVCVERGHFSFPNTLLITNIKNLDLVPDPSVKVPISTNGCYNRVPGIHMFDSTFETVGGINNPKKVVCVGTDGKRRTLLIKGKDDLRQDAVMQQVFSVMNQLLLRDPETCRHKLAIRTYRVQPLSQRSGVIEWCENTEPIGVYLTGPKGQGGAHRRFHPHDMIPNDCRRILATVAKADAENKLRAYLEICSKFHPAFQYFFLEKFPSAGVWFERRLAYIRSVATSSMIGYILGIGDRHLMNILIDNKTAEAIHIDLGIAFEQGKTLPTPETVPFRLTRDIEAAMGCAGIDGVFRLCCERTMRMLRASKDTIITLLEVLLHDPLYAWTITPEKAMSMQSSNSDNSASVFDSDYSQSRRNVNAMAERALMRLKTKLQGMEEGGVVSTVEGQVSGLIQQARDPSNLSRLFAGWQAYL